MTEVRVVEKRLQTKTWLELMYCVYLEYIIDCSSISELQDLKSEIDEANREENSKDH